MDYEKAYKEAMERAWSIREDGYPNEQVKEVIERIFPSLAESEDEKIIDELKGLVIASTYGDPERHKFLAWLEKQKENQKSAESISPDCVLDVEWANKIIRDAILALADDVDYNRDEPLKYKKEIDALKELREALRKQKEQKPIEQNTSPIIDSALNDYVCKAYAALDKENGGVLSFARLQHLAMDIQKWCDEQKQAEWSEEDKQMLEDIIVFVSGYADKRVVNKWVSFLKSLCPQSKQEWSEEDKRMLSDISWAIRYCAYDDKRKERVHDWFQSHLACIKPHWKPSEEQMIALQVVLDHGVAAPDREAVLAEKHLESLYEQLDRL